MLSGRDFATLDWVCFFFNVNFKLMSLSVFRTCKINNHCRVHLWAEKNVDILLHTGLKELCFYYPTNKIEPLSWMAILAVEKGSSTNDNMYLVRGKITFLTPVHKIWREGMGWRIVTSFMDDANWIKVVWWKTVLSCHFTQWFEMNSFVNRGFRLLRPEKKKQV